MPESFDRTGGVSAEASGVSRATGRRESGNRSTMEFAPQQDEALKAVSRWLKEGRSPLFRLFGYAGTGKTTLARHFAEHVDGDVLFAAFTGKAAQVLRSKGATNARTIHSLIYRPRGEEEVSDEETGKTSIAPMFAINRQSPVAKAALIIVDECSMVDEALGKDLMSFGTPILVLGDPGQLPPVSGGGYFTNEEPDYLLTDIHRQARDNPIIQLAMHVREGKEIMHGDYGTTAKVISKNEVTQSLVLDADQVLVGTNKTRRRYNMRLRELKGFTTDYPQSGDKLVCLRNDPAKGLLNGSLWQVMTSSKETVKPGINLMIRPEDDDMDRGAAKIKIGGAQQVVDHTHLVHGPPFCRDAILALRSQFQRLLRLGNRLRHFLRGQARSRRHA